jgi:6-phosphofructokinase 1
MGRHAGFLTAAAGLGRAYEDDGPHLIYLPEAPFSVEGFLADIEACMKKWDRCVVACSEGIADEEERPILSAILGSGEKDSHGNVALSGTGALGDFLAEEVKKRLGVKRVRADTFGYLQRCFPTIVSSIDAREARDVGAFAVRAVTSSGERSGSVAIRRLPGKAYAADLHLTPLSTVAKKTRSLDRHFIAESRHDITPAFVRYALPLVGKLPRLGRLRGKRVARKEP